MVRYLFILIMVLIVNLGIFAQGSLPNRYHASYLNMSTGMPNNFADDIFQDSYGYMWISTHGGGLVRYDGYNFLNFGLGSIGVQLRSNNCRNVYEDSFRRLWIAFEEGPQVLDLKTMQPIVPPCENEALAPKLSKAGLFFYDLKRKQLEIPFPEALSVRGCIGSLITRDGRLLMGEIRGYLEMDLKSRHSGKRFFAVKRHPYKLDHPESGVIDKILSFCQTHDGKIWMGSNGYGMYCLSTNQSGKQEIRSFTMSNGLANNTVKGIVEDQQGMLWIATDHGLSVFNPKTETFSSFYKNDGLLSAQFYFNGAIRSRSGVIYLGTDCGMMAVNGFSHSSYTQKNLRFTELLVDNQPVLAGSKYLDEDISLAKKIRLHESDKSFTIHFSALNYGSETQGVYLCRMKGYENDWVQLQPGQHSVRYSTLPAGDYEFEVKYAPSIASSQEQVASIEVSVTPYFWKSWWFVSIILIGIIAAVQYIYVRRLEKMREQEVEALYRPIEAALKESDEPGKLQNRIQAILENQRRYQESQDKTVLADKEAVEKNSIPFMDEVMSIMEKNFHDSEFGVQELADALGMNRSVLSKKLNAETGLPTSQFIRNYRLDIARKMITDNVANRNITEIAYRVGFNDPKYFTRCFTKQYGMSPSGYKDEIS